MNFTVQYFDSSTAARKLGTLLLNRKGILLKGKGIKVFSKYRNLDLLELSDEDLHITLLNSSHPSMQIIMHSSPDILDQLTEKVSKDRRTLWFNRLAWLALLIAAVFVAYPHAKSWVLYKVPVQKEEKLLSYIGYAPLKVSKNPKAATVFFAKVKSTLLNPYWQKHIQLHLIDSEENNAFALPGGHVIITTKLVSGLKHQNELVGILAHEFEHIKQRHILQQTLKQLLLKPLMLSSTQQFASLLFERKFSRDKEHSADLAAGRLLFSKGIGSQGLAQFLRRIHKSEKEYSEPMTWLSTHPHSRGRIRLLEKFTVKKPKTVASQAEWAQLQANQNTSSSIALNR